MTSPAEHVATVREDSALLADWAEEPTAIANVDADSCRERIMYATEQLLVRAERANELERERDEAWNALQQLAADHYFARAEAAEARVEQLETALRLIASCEPVTDGDTVSIARAALTKEPA